jgi:hypothetical protein
LRNALLPSPFFQDVLPLPSNIWIHIRS